MLLFLRDNKMIAIKFFVIACAIIAWITSWFFLSWLGILGALFSLLCFISVVLRRNEASLVTGFVTVLIGVHGFFSELKHDPRTADIFYLSATASADPNSYGLSLELKKLVNETIRVCMFSTILSVSKAAFDATSVVYEPAWLGVFSWAVKPTYDKEKCVNNANKVAIGSQRFAAELAMINTNHDLKR